MSNEYIGALVTLIAFLVPFAILASNWIMEYTGLRSNKRKKEEAYNNFNKVVENLSSGNPATQLSAAVLLRRYLTLEIGKAKYLHQETIGVISSILRTIPTGVYQKTLADGLAYGVDLSGCDLQRTNLQNVYLGSKSHKVILNSTDMFMANLTYGLIDNVVAHKIILYDALLYRTRIKNSDFTGANFMGADLTNAKFTNVILKDADFSKATNIPEEIASGIVDGIYTSYTPVSTEDNAARKTIFFSMPGDMSKKDELTVLAYREHLIKSGFEVIYYTRDTYPRFGQLTQIKAAIEKCSGMIAFGTRQTFIKEGIYRPEMNGERLIENEWMSTPWNEMEVGMATMIGLPILLVKDSGIEDGIFDDVISEAFIFRIPASTDAKELNRNQTFSEWSAKVV